MNDSFAHRAAEWDSPEKVEMTKIFVAEMLRHVKPDKNWKALEIGAGTGLVGLQLLPIVNTIVFEDTSAAMLDVLRNKLRDEKSVEIVHGEVYDYETTDIDFVFSCMAFHHIPEIEKTLKHLHEIMTLDATIVVGDLRAEDGSFHRFEPIPHRGFEPEVLISKFQGAGFKVLVTKTYNTLTRERVEGISTDYDQFILIAKKN